MSQAAMAHDEAEDRYFTQVDAGDVRLFTLDQLDAAFNAGLIHENTYVCLEGDSQWLTLGEVAGLGDEEESAPVSAQVVAPHYAAASYGVQPSHHLPQVMLAPSIAPVVNDLSLNDFDSDLLSMRPKRRTGKVVAGLAVVALGALGFLVVQSGGLRGLKLPALGKQLGGESAAASLSLSGLNDSRSLSEPKALPAPLPAAEPAKVEPAKVEPAAAAADAKDKADSDAASPKKDDRFSDEMKAALLSKDKQQAASQKSKKAARAVASKQRIAKSGKSKSSGGFKTSGSAYDPLNGKL
jgi:hypothetical protein